MSRSTDPSNFFQTTSALDDSRRKAQKSKNTKGNPIKLSSKILAVAPDPQNEDGVYVAESAGNVKRMNLETNEFTATYSGPKAPLTSLAVSATSHTLFAGCWDKSIWSWDISSRKPVRQFLGHGDFVKSLLLLPVIVTQNDGSKTRKELLASGSADASIIIWDISSGEKLHTLKGHTRGILSLAFDPFDSNTNNDGQNNKQEGESTTVTFLSAGSDRQILHWHTNSTQAGPLNAEPLLPHETSIDKLAFDTDGDLWTASADRTTKCLSRAQSFAPDGTSLMHPDFVRDVLIADDDTWIVTACRDENVRVWDKGSGKLHHVFEGHFEEVTALAWLPKGKKVVSVGIDATVRTWSLEAKELERAVKEAEDERLGKNTKEEANASKKEGVMTEEEERELAELMGDSD